MVPNFSQNGYYNILLYIINFVQQANRAVLYSKLKEPLKRGRLWHFQNLYYLSDFLSEYCGKEGAWLMCTG